MQSHHLPGEKSVRKAIAGKRYIATTDFDKLRECDAVIICVPTPLGKHREPDNSYIHVTSKEIAKRLARRFHVSIDVFL